MNRKLFAVAAFAAVMSIKLPYEAGQRFIVTQGYNSPPTHVGKDLYAIDFSQDGCDAYGKLAVAAGGGTVMLAQEAGYNGGYGTQVLVINESRIVTRYAHMIPNSVPVATGDAVVQGEPLGEIGNTGLVAGAACPTHPGTHIHFAMYGENADGSFSPFRPEPISGYVGITAGRWYLSDNALAVTTVPAATAIINRAAQAVFGGGDVRSTPVAAVSSAPPAVAANNPQPPLPISASTLPDPTGGVSASPPPSPLPPSSPSSTPSAPAITITDTSFNSTTLAIDLAWQVPTGTATTGMAAGASSTVYEIFYAMSSAATASSTLLATTTATNFSYPVATTDFGSSWQFTITALFDNDGSASGGPLTMSTVATAPISLPAWWTVIQSADDTNSNGSWYSDTWYDLGTGFYGTVRSLTLKGAIENSDYLATHLYLDEYIDAAYTQLNQSWKLSDSAPFTDGMRQVTIGDLNVPLQPNKYYRLRAYQDYQNRSVILAGTAATGTAMWNEFIGGIGRVEHYYPFYPYLAAVMIPDYPPLLPPVPVATMTIAFDAPNSAITMSWSATTDPDTTSSLLTYQINIATSTASSTPPTALDPAAWQSVSKNLATTIPVIFDDSYLIDLRAVDDLGNTSTPLSVPWNFPAGYFPIPQQLDHSAQLSYGGAQSFAFPAPITVSSMAFFTKSDQNSAYCCAESVVNIRADASGMPGAVLATSDAVTIGYNNPPREETYSFSPSAALPAGTYWFEVDPDSRPNNDPTYVLGSASDTYLGGAWSGAPGQDAYFRIQE